MTALLLVVLLAPAGCGDETDVAQTTTTGATSTTTTSTTIPAAECSAAGLSPSPTPQPGLPEPVADMRTSIVEAAVACDFERLEQLALAGDSRFTHSFGAEGDPSEFWRRQEDSDRGPEPLRYLVGVLQRPHKRVEVQGDPQYVWPSAFGYDSWDAVPEEAMEALKPLYTDESFDSFERFGSYTGYRVGITPDGDWLFFVSGD